MKNSKFVILSILFFLLSNIADAQSFGFKGGVNLANVLAKDNSTTYSKDFKLNPGFHVGGTIEWPLQGFLSFETGLLFTKKGYRNENEGLEELQKISVNIYYLDVPLYLKANANLGNKIVLSGMVGPYLDYGLFGKFKADISTIDEDISYNNDINWGEDLNRFDFGLTFGTEIVFNPFLIGVSYDLGLGNILSDSEDGGTIKNRLFKISAGYKFN